MKLFTTRQPPTEVTTYKLAPVVLTVKPSRVELASKVIGCADPASIVANRVVVLNRLRLGLNLIGNVSPRAALYVPAATLIVEPLAACVPAQVIVFQAVPEDKPSLALSPVVAT